MEPASGSPGRRELREEVRALCNGWKTHKHIFESIFDWWDEGKKTKSNLSLNLTHEKLLALHENTRSLSKTV